MTDPYRYMSTQDLEAHAKEWCSLPLKQPGPLPTPAGHPENPYGEPEPELDAGEDFWDVSGWFGSVFCAAVICTGMLLPMLLGIGGWA